MINFKLGHNGTDVKILSDGEDITSKLKEPSISIHTSYDGVTKANIIAKSYGEAEVLPENVSVNFFPKESPFLDTRAVDLARSYLTIALEVLEEESVPPNELINACVTDALDHLGGGVNVLDNDYILRKKNMKRWTSCSDK